MIHLLISTCVMAGDRDRKGIYLQRISHAYNEFRRVVPDIRVVVLNNCGEQNASYLSLLEDDDLELFHTTNNSVPTANKGWKELKDVKDYIDYHDIPEDDFIIKLTGRYLVERSSPFLKALGEKWTPRIKCMIRLGNYEEYGIESFGPGDEIDCLSGLVGFSCTCWKDMPLPCEEYKAVEWIMAEASIGITDKIILQDLGINIFW